MKHSIALTKDNQLYVWGSNQQNQLGKPSVKGHTIQPVHLVAFENAKTRKIVCGSYHNFAFSERAPILSFEEEVKPPTPQNNALVIPQAHKDEDCPNIEQVKKLKSEIKRLRQELILNPKKKTAELDEEESVEGLNEEEQAALKLLQPEQRKIFAELEQAGANSQYLKRKLK